MKTKEIVKAIGADKAWTMRQLRLENIELKRLGDDLVSSIENHAQYEKGYGMSEHMKCAIELWKDYTMKKKGQNEKP